MKMFANLLSDTIKDATGREIAKAQMELFQERLHLESSQGRVTTLEKRLERLQGELLAMKTQV